MRHRRIGRRWRWAGGIALAVAAVSPAVAGHAASADVGDGSSFDATASAYGFDFIFSNPVIPAGISPEGAGPVAQSELTSLPSGTSFSSFPYPGDVVAGVPGLAAGIVTGLPPIPPYPAIVNAGYGQGPQSQNLPGIALSADTEAGQSRAHATVGTDAQGSIADAVVTNDPNQGVSAVATTTDSGVGLGSLGSIGTITSTSSASQNADGSVATSSHFEITGLKFPALDLTIPATTPNLAPIPNLPIPSVPLPFAGTELKDPELGFVDGAFTVQLPLLGNQMFQVPTAAVLSAFQAMGVTVTYSAPVTTPTSIVGAGLTFHYTVPAPPAAINQIPELGTLGATPVDVVFGRASASLSAESGGADSVVPVGGDTGTTGVSTPNTSSVPAGTTGVSGSTPTSTGTGTLPATSTGSTGTTDAGSAPLTGGTGSTGSTPVLASGGSTGATGTSAAPSGGGGSGVGLVRDLTPLSPVSWSIYLVIVAAGLIGTFSTQTLRLLGVKHR